MNSLIQRMGSGYISPFTIRSYNVAMLSLLFAVAGLLVGYVINILADNLPERMRPQRPYCLQCGEVYPLSQSLALFRILSGGGKCANCGARPRLRPVLVEGGMVLLFALLPSFFTEPADLIMNSLYVAVLVLVIVIDLEHRLILNVVTLPVTGLAVIGSVIVSDEENTLALSLLGAGVGFALFFAVYWLGQWIFGPGALGFGDVKLAMAMGAMLGFHRILFALTLAILIGGVTSLLVVLVNRRVNQRSYLPYGQYLAIAGIIMLIWGARVVDWYTQS